MKGFKVFNSDWTCRGFQFEVGKVFEEDITPECCEKGFHFCKNLVDCFSYYRFNPENKVAEIEALGDVDDEEDDSKCCTNKIRIIRELTWNEVLEMINIGHHNEGIKNIGNYNVGSYNTGSCNTGDYNTGSHNEGHYNTGDRNPGDYNSGSNNSGYGNTGSNNSGHHNSGHHNSGNYNSGHHNSGEHNTGVHNSGHVNTGNYNLGNHNSGDFNSGNYNIGCFNTETPEVITMFNKPCNWSIYKWFTSHARFILINMPSDKDKNYRQIWWNNLADKDKEAVINLPNFDKHIFKKITGIEI